jgi:hypothetical protein
MPKFNPHNLPEEARQPADVRFLEVKVEPWPDGRRIRVHVTLTPFVTRPDLNASVCDEQGSEVCSANIIQTMDDRMVFTLHLRGDSPSNRFTLQINVFYEDIGQVDERTLEFEIQPGE